MRPIIIVMLLVDLGIILATTLRIAMHAPAADRRHPMWTSFAIALLVGGATSSNIASDHPGKAGADILAFAGPMMIGMAIMCALALLRERRDTRAAPTA